MSVDPLPPSPVAPPPAAPARRYGWLARLLAGRRADDQVVVYHHSTLFYWWPVWLLGFVFAGVSYFDSYLAIVPPGTVAAEGRQVEVEGGKFEPRDVLILDKNHAHYRKVVAGEDVPFQPTIHVSRWRLLGTIYALVLLVVIAITNLTVRGLWSIFVVFTIVMLAIILAVAQLWGQIFQNIGRLSIYINQGGYLLISTALFVLWLVNFFLFDRQTYMIFTPGQVRVRLEIGGGETVYDTTGMVVQKQRSDLFRHWVLGLGSGDLLVKPVGVTHALELPNVLHVGQVVRHIEDVVKERVVIRGDDETRLS